MSGTAMTMRDWCYTFAAADGGECNFSNGRVLARAHALARSLAPYVPAENAAVVVDLSNGPLLVDALLACCLLGRPLVALNQRMAPAEKQRRLAQLAPALSVDVMLDDAFAGRLEAGDSLDGTASAEGTAPVGACAAAGSGADVLADVLRAAPPEDIAVVMFTSGTTGTPKAAALTWGQLVASADASNHSLRCDARSVWQAALPLYHIGGLQVVLRSFLAGAPFVLYERFDANRLLDDAACKGATHVSVVDKTLQDLLTADQLREAPVLSRYECILLGGSAPNGRTLRAARAAGARVFASYGMTETSSQVANRLVDDDFDGGLALLEGVEARILDADGEGVGDLALRGPSILSRYLNASAPLDDGFFVTGDRAALRDGRLYVRERTGDMFVSGGENVYPAEIERCIDQIEGVAGCYVFGLPHETWGRRPAALVESPLDPEEVKRLVGEHAARYLSRFARPDVIVVVGEMPRAGIGKVDRSAAEELVLAAARG